MNLETNLPLLIDLHWKSAAILLIAFGASFAGRRVSAANRHVIWLTALTALLLLPITALATPRWSYDFVHRATLQNSLPELPPMGAKAEGAPEVGTLERSNSGRETRSFRDSIRWPEMAIVGWMAGAALVLFKRAAVTWKLHRSVRRGRPVSDGRMLALTNRVDGEKRCRWNLRESEECQAPLVYGIWRPIVLLPIHARGWSDERLSAVFLHEFGHIHRFDCLSRLLMDLACAFYWVNPLVWHASRQMRVTQEQACDDIVLSAGVSATDYASQLIEIVRNLSTDKFHSNHALAMAQPSTIETRVCAIIDPKRDRARLSFRVVAAGGFAFFTALSLCGIAQVRGTVEDSGGSGATSAPTQSTQSGDKQADAAKSASATGARARAESITIPRLEFRDTTLEEAVAFLRTKSVENDPEKKGVNIVVKQSPDLPQANFSLSLTNIPLYEALKYVAVLTGMEITNGLDALFIHPMGAKDSVITAPPPGSEEAVLMEKAKKIVFPSIDFHEATVEEAIQFLRQKGCQLAGDSQKVNIVLKDTKEKNLPRITMELKGASFLEALRTVAYLANLEVQLDGNIFYLRPRGE